MYHKHQFDYLGRVQDMYLFGCRTPTCAMATYVPIIVLKEELLGKWVAHGQA